MTWDETFEKLSADWRASAPNPARMQQLLGLLGHPEEHLHFVHIAGTNGKGSASAMLSSILIEAGYRTGTYISPHLSAINERWAVDGENISDERLSEILEIIQPVILSMADTPTKFEILTALGFLYFCQEGCQIVVLEVGLGGRLDATNSIPVPDCAMIMNIGLEHTEILGNTLQEIAFEKGGIIKSGGDIVLYHQSEEVRDVIADLCLERSAILHETSPEESQPLSMGAAVCQCFHYKNRKDLHLSLLGKYQIRNACAVLDAVDILIGKGYHISEAAIRSGLEYARWPGRFEVLQTEPLFIVDGAHNPNGVEALMESVKEYLSDYKIVFLMGVMADKDYDDMIRLAAPYAAHFIAQMPGEEPDRALEGSALATRIHACFSGPVETAASVREGVAMALRASASDAALSEAVTTTSLSTIGAKSTSARSKTAVVCFGSLYQVSEIRNALQEMPLECSNSGR